MTPNDSLHLFYHQMRSCKCPFTHLWPHIRPSSCVPSPALSSGAACGRAAGPGPVLGARRPANGPHRTEFHIWLQSAVLREDARWHIFRLAVYMSLHKKCAKIYCTNLSVPPVSLAFREGFVPFASFVTRHHPSPRGFPFCRVRSCSTELKRR